MRVIFFLIAWAFAQVSLAQQAPRFELHGYVTAGNVSTYRGIRRSEEDLSLQAALELTVPANFFLALQAADSTYRTFDGQETQGHTVDYMLGWRRRIGRDTGLDVRVRYSTFPQLAEAIDYAYTELDVTLSLAQRFALQLAYYDDGPAFTGRGAAAEVLWREPWQGNELSAALGAARYFDPVQRSYAYWDVGVSRAIGRAALDLRYHYTPRTRRWVGRQPAHGLWALSVTFGI